MTPKLSESDKEAILTLYQSSEETTSTLAHRYGVSNTTISRILKSSLSEEDYDALVHQKRSSRNLVGAESTPRKSLPVLQSTVVDLPADDSLVPLPLDLASRSPKDGEVRSKQPPLVRRRQRSSISDREDAEPEIPAAMQLELPPSPPNTDEIAPGFFQQDDRLVGNDLEDNDLVEMIAEELSSSKPRLGEFEDEGDFDEDLEDEDDLEDDLDEDDSDGSLGMTLRHTRQDIPLQVLPLSEASIPRTFYLVVDHAAELVTRPLQDFGDLGQIPPQDVQAETLPIFDNHRVARRFSKKTQRVVKVPDGRMLEKVGPYLQAKGITRLLIDGQVYSFD